MYNCRELRVWQAGMELAKEVYVLTREFPGHEMYGLTSQLRRAVVSVPANILEAIEVYRYLPPRNRKRYTTFSWWTTSCSITPNP
jgi:four helix bundle protein